jgi:hypothetical protein
MKRKRTIWRWIRYLFILLLMLCVISHGTIFSELLIFKELRNFVVQQIQTQLDEIAARGESNQSTFIDKTMVRWLVYLGSVAFQHSAPEAVQILNHYIDGNGSTLQLDSNYFKISPVIRKYVEQDYGVYGPVGFDQQEDYRLSLALNPFYLDISKSAQGKKIKVYNQIEFDHLTWRTKTKTQIRLGKIDLKFQDGLIRILQDEHHCIPFTAEVVWIEPES